MLLDTDRTNTFIYLSSIRKRRYYKKNILHGIRVPGNLLVVVAKGHGHLYTENHNIPIKPGQCVWLIPGMHIEIWQESDTLEVYLLGIRELAFARRKGGWNLSPALSPQWGTLKPVLSKQMLDEVEHLYEESKSRTVTDTGIQQRLQSLIRGLNEQFAIQCESENAAAGIDRTISYMHKHYDKKITLETLSDLAGLTPTSYSRSFKKVKNLSPFEYLNQIRMNSAKRLLEQPEYSIKAAASAVGIGSEFYFSRLFKQTVGLSPSLFVRRKHLKIASASCFRYKDCLHSLGIENVFELNTYLSMTTKEDRRIVEHQLEQMRVFKPDVIIADARHGALFEALKEIAPTVILHLTMDWRTGYMRLAELVAREAEARYTCRQLDARVQAARKRLKQSIGSKTISLVRLQHGKIRVQGRTDHPVSHLLYNELGLRPGSFVPANQRLKDMTVESLAPFDTDYLMVYRDSEEDDALFQAIASSGTSEKESNQTLLIPNWVSMSWSPSGQHQIIDELEQLKI